MYESESNDQVENIEQIPTKVLDQFRGFRAQVTSRTVLPWGEHCTECAFPTCYTTCDLYRPREDGKCRRFLDGVVRIDFPESSSAYLQKIRFKRWGKLWTVGNVQLHGLDRADRIEKQDQSLSRALYQIQLPQPVKNFAVKRRYGWKKRMAAGAKPGKTMPTHFVVECFNPGPATIDLTIVMRHSESPNNLPFEYLFSVKPGYQRELIPTSTIGQLVDLRRPFGVDLVPNEIEEGATIYFGLIDFATIRPSGAEKAQTSGAMVKCVVWDLDNTLWSGILVEDGLEKLVLRPGIKEVIEALDRRGILHSVASKNSFDEAMHALKHFGLDEYFLYPQISWGPKSEAVKAIAKKINVGIDTLLFIDDSRFEREEVMAVCPSVHTLDAERYVDLAVMPELHAPATEEAAMRRLMYRREEQRDSIATQFSGDYFKFLRECRMEIVLDSLSQANLERVHELAQRTNQMNFSGNRYSKAALEEILNNGELDTYVLTCKDRFGSYGIVGFSIVEPREPRIIDLMFSCRVQSKRVEHTFLKYLVQTLRDRGAQDIWANYKKTTKNAPSGKSFEEVGMEEAGIKDGVSNLVMRHNVDLADDKVATIVDRVHPVVEGNLIR